ncbi:hypothetical protein KI688_000691 [Linnemannia hyalina]|uniref:Uncharacterized protein n=1 Tax=Linnemannia hyalina TaxID=64524 RepID=A0A9P8BYB8_9FUNG|nr:hypothetical protein KI688_000691 [Linnemannia hyalina]
MTWNTKCHQNHSSLAGVQHGRSLTHVFQHNDTQLFPSPATVLDQAITPSQQQQQHIYTDRRQGLSSQHQHRSSALLYSEWPEDFGHTKHHLPYPQSPNSSSSQLTPRGASAPAEPPRRKKAKRIFDDEEEEETQDVVDGDEEEKEGEDEVVVVEEEGNEFLPPWMFDDDDDGPVEGTPRTTPKSRIFQQLANGINSWYASPNQVQYTVKQAKTKVETIKASFKRGQDLVHKSGFGTTNPSKTWKQQILKTSPHHFKLEANCPTRAAVKAARRRKAKANDSEIEQMVGEGIAGDYSERDEDVLEARTMQELKQRGARVQKGKIVQKGKTAVREKRAQEESPTTIYQRPSQRPLPKKFFTKAAPADSPPQASNKAGGAQGSTSKAQIKDNYTHKSGGGRGGSDKMQSLADSVRAMLESEKKNKDVELLIMRQRLALEESEAKEKAEARRASLALEERRIDIEAQRMNNEHILKMAQLQKEKDLEIYRMDLESFSFDNTLSSSLKRQQLLDKGGQQAHHQERLIAPSLAPLPVPAMPSSTRSASRKRDAPASQSSNGTTGSVNKKRRTDLYGEIADLVNAEATDQTHEEWQPWVERHVKYNIAASEQKYRKAKQMWTETGAGDDDKSVLRKRVLKICPLFDKFDRVYSSNFRVNPPPMVQTTTISGEPTELLDDSEEGDESGEGESDESDEGNECDEDEEGDESDEGGEDVMGLEDHRHLRVEGFDMSLLLAGDDDELDWVNHGLERMAELNRELEERRQEHEQQLQQAKAAFERERIEWTLFKNEEMAKLNRLKGTLDRQESHSQSPSVSALRKIVRNSTDCIVVDIIIHQLVL